MTRLALLGLVHESNTFASSATDLDAFVHSGGVLRRAEIAEHHGDAETIAAGYLSVARRGTVEVVPLILAEARPSGTISADAYERLTEEMITALVDGGPWDGVLLALHGAAVADGQPDADGHLARRVRAAVGAHVPVGITLDMHGNISGRLIQSSTVCVGYRTNPHVDAKARATECAELVLRTARAEIRPVQAFARIPVVINILRMFTGEEPMQSLVRSTERIAGDTGMLSASLWEGFPYADVPQLGMSCLAIHDGNRDRARSAVDRLAAEVWEARDDYVGHAPSPSEAVRRAAGRSGPVALFDVGDNVGGGSPGDSTILLSEAARQRVPRLLETIRDPEAVELCAGAGVGASVRLLVGGKTDELHGTPVEVSGTVESISGGRWEDARPTHGGYRYFDAGKTAVVRSDLDHTLVLTTKVAASSSAGQYLSLNIEPQSMQIIVGKGVVAPRTALERYASEVTLVDTPGVTTARIDTLPYTRRGRVWPLDPDVTYRAHEQAT